MRRINARLAAHAGVRQVEASVRADAAADAAGAAVLRVWQEFLTLLKRLGHWSAAYHAARAVFARLLPTVADATADRLGRTAVWGHRTAAANLTRELPPRILAWAAARRLTEGRDADALADRRPDHAADLPGAVRPGFRGNNNPVALYEAAPSVADILFPGFTPEEVTSVVYDSGWRERLAAGTRLAAPDRLAQAVAAGLAAGKSQAEIARDIAPLVQGVQASARRIARTESMRVANAAQMRCHAQLGDLVVGYQVHATLDQHTRPWHAHRSGTVYYLDPQAGQKGPRQMPHPPDEAEDAGERPPNTPKTAWNCRCYLTPVLRDPGDVTPADLGTPIVPDPLVYSEWFDRAGERERKIAVGVRRYAVVQDRLGRRAVWGDFLDPAKGTLLHHATLRAETPAARAERTAKVQVQIAQSRLQLAQTSAAGFLPGVGLPPALAAPVLSGSLPGGRTVVFTPHSAANNRRETTILVDPRKLDADWSQDAAAYIPPGRQGESEVAGRRAGVERFLAKGEPVQASRVALNPHRPGGVSFDDGRHRFAVLRDRGADQVAVTVPKKEAAEFQRRYGKTAALPPTADPAQIVADAVRAAGGRYNSAPMPAVRAELTRLGLADRAAQDAAIGDARKRGLVSGANWESNRHMDPQEAAAMAQALHRGKAGDERIGYLSLRTE